MLNGCVAKKKSIAQQASMQPVKVKSFSGQKTWGKVQSSGVKKDDCVDCVAVPIQSSKPPSGNSMFANVAKVPTYENTYNTRKVASVQSYTAYANKEKVSDATKDYGGFVYKEKASDTNIKTKSYQDNVIPAPAPITTSYGTYDTAVNTSSMSRVNSSYAATGDIAIQVGAFSQYSGAQVYEKRYGALTSKYNIAIQTTTKNNKPIYKVRIEGFKSETEAKRFMNSYGIRDGFLVRK